MADELEPDRISRREELGEDVRYVSELLAQGAGGLLQVRSTVPDVDIATGVVRASTALTTTMHGAEWTLTRVDLRTGQSETLRDDLTHIRERADGALAYTNAGWVCVFDSDLRPVWSAEPGARISHVEADAAGVVVIELVDGRVFGHDEKTGAKVWERAFGEFRNFSSWDAELWFTSSAGLIEVLDARTGATLRTFPSEVTTVSNLDSACRFGELAFYVPETECAIRVFDANTGALLQVLTLPEGLAPIAGRGVIRSGECYLLSLGKQQMSQRGRVYGLLVLSPCDSESPVTIEPGPEREITVVPQAKGKFAVALSLRAQDEAELLRYALLLLQDAGWTYGATFWTKGDAKFNGSIRLSVAFIDGRPGADALLRDKLPNLAHTLDQMSVSGPAPAKKPLVIEVANLTG